MHPVCMFRGIVLSEARQMTILGHDFEPEFSVNTKLPFVYVCSVCDLRIYV